MQTIDTIDQLSLKDRLPCLYVEHGKLSFSSYEFAFANQEGRFTLPLCSVTTLLIGPRVSITSDFVANAAQNNVLLLWVGEGCTKIYSTGMSSVTASTARVLQQALVLMSWDERERHIRRLYHCMFPGLEVPKYGSVDQYRGWEGSEVRRNYRRIANEKGLEWRSRKDAPKALQTVLNVCNGCLYAFTEAITLSCSLHSSIGVVHQGDPRSLVYDIADTVKFNTFVPEVFSFYSSGAKDPFRDSRKFCRDLFLNGKISKLLFENTKYVFDL